MNSVKGDAALKIINCLMFLIGLAAFCALISEYGFGISSPSGQTLHKLQIWGVYLFCGLQLAKLIFAPNPILYITRRWFDFILVFLMFFQLSADMGIKQMPEYKYLVLTGAPVPAGYISLALVQAYFLIVALMETRFIAHLLLRLKASPMVIFTLSYQAFVIMGTLTLMLPKSAINGKSIGLTDAFFIASSAASGTGLSTLDIGASLSVLGQSFVMLLMQTGSFGLLVLFTLIVFFTGGRINKNEAGTFVSVISMENVKEAKLYLLKIISLMLALEGLSTVYLYYNYGWGNTVFMKLFNALFHSVAAFTNSGFSTYPGTGFFAVATKSGFLVCIIILMLAGSAGNINLLEIPKSIYLLFKRKTRAISCDLKSLLAVNAVIFAVGIPLCYWLLKDNALAHLPQGYKILNSVFTVVSCRSTGFSAADLAVLSGGGVLLLIVLMVIGGGPVSFAGGIRTISLSVIFALIKNKISGSKNSCPSVFGKPVVPKTVKKVFLICMVYFSVLLIGTVSVYLIDGFSFSQTVFEVASALGTVGLSMGITASLSVPAKWIVALCMLFGSYIQPASALFINNRDASRDKIIIG